MIKYLILTLLISSAVFSQEKTNEDIVEQALKDAKAEAELDKILDNKVEAKESFKEIPVPVKKKVEQIKKQEQELPIKEKVEVKQVIRKKYLSEEEMEILKEMQREKEIKEGKKKVPVYMPSPIQEKQLKTKNYRIERDSSRIQTVYMSPFDATDVKTCFFGGGLTIILGDSIDTQIQDAILDDNIYFSSKIFKNKKSIYIRQKKELSKGETWETALRLVREDNDKAYLINIFAEACPSGPYPYKKVIYIEDKNPAIHAQSNYYTPEDRIIAETKGLPRLQKNKVKINDMLYSAGSEWAIFSLELLPKGSTTPKPVFKVLDNLQVVKLDSVTDFLEIHSEKASKMYGQRAYRYRIKININKEYMKSHQYIYILMVDEENGHYQNIPVNTLNFYNYLKERGFKI
tara:strand:+ start:2339 stop:3547 length:1209 start_codon:yes stop_codon:yes gene_type:complete